MDFYERALELKEETIENRRYMHQHAETGLYLPKTKEYVINKLQEYEVLAYLGCWVWLTLAIRN